MRNFLAIALLAAAMTGHVPVRSADNALPAMTVYKSPNCGCCEKWIQHLREAGFPVSAHDHGNLDRVRGQLGVPRALAGCHTAQVAGYAIEGHVPAAQIRRLLSEKLDVTGISVPGMPIGSPGMESEGGRAYRVLAWRKDGSSSVYSVEQPRQR